MDKIDVEPEHLVESQQTAPENIKAKRCNGFIGLQRELSPEELKETGTQKMILLQIDALQAENERLRELETVFHEKDKKLAVLEAQISSQGANLVVKNLITGIGWTLLGSSPYVHDKVKSRLVTGVTVVVALLLIIVPMVFIYCVGRKGKKDYED